MFRFLIIILIFKEFQIRDIQNQHLNQIIVHIAINNNCYSVMDNTLPITTQNNKC